MRTYSVHLIEKVCEAHIIERCIKEMQSELPFLEQLQIIDWTTDRDNGGALVPVYEEHINPERAAKALRSRKIIEHMQKHLDHLNERIDGELKYWRPL